MTRKELLSDGITPFGVWLVVGMFIAVAVLLAISE